MSMNTLQGITADGNLVVIRTTDAGVLLTNMLKPKSYEQLVIDDQVRVLTVAKYQDATSANISIEGGSIRVTVDGVTTPTATIGRLFKNSDEVELESYEEMVNFKAIRVDDVSATLNIDYKG